MCTVTTILPIPGPEKVGPVFQSVPLTVRAAWLTYKAVRALSTLPDSALTQYEALERACWEAGRRTGYFILDDRLVGWVGMPRHRHLSIVPASRPLKPETHVEKAFFFNVYGRNP